MHFFFRSPTASHNLSSPYSPAIFVRWLLRRACHLKRFQNRSWWVSWQIPPWSQTCCSYWDTWRCWKTYGFGETMQVMKNHRKLLKNHWKSHSRLDDESVIGKINITKLAQLWDDNMWLMVLEHLILVNYGQLIKDETNFQVTNVTISGCLLEGIDFAILTQKKIFAPQEYVKYHWHIMKYPIWKNLSWPMFTPNHPLATLRHFLLARNDFRLRGTEGWHWKSARSLGIR